MRCRRGPSDKARDEHHKHEDRREADHHEAEELHGALGERGVSRDVLADLRPASDACEPQDDQAAHGQGDVAREEVEEVEDRLAAEEGDVGELAEREAGQGADDGERERGEHGRARTLHLVLVDEEGDDDLDHRDGRRDGRHRDAQVEDHGEDLTERKLREDGGHRDEGEAGTCGRVESEGEDARHDHQAAENGGDDRKERDPEAAVDEVRVLIKVRAVGEHAPATHAQREESEAHGLQQGAPGEGVGIELEEELKIKVRPLSWPIGQGARFKGVYNIYEKQLNLFTPNKQRVTEKVSVDIDSSELDQHVGEREAQQLRDDLELVNGVYPEFEVESYRSAEVAPVFFGSALNNFGVQELLNCFVEIAPSPRPTKAEERMVSPEEPKFTGFIFKITANIDPNHRSCIAFCKVCSGKFVRNQPYQHIRLGKTVRFSSPTQFMAQRKSTIDEAYPGDIVGLPDNGIFKIGDTLTEGEQLHFRGLPSFSPEMFKYIENDDPMKSKQFQKGLEQLMNEGVAQLFVNQFNGRRVVGTVGQLQFEVIQYRLENEYNAKCRWEPVHLHKACWIESDNAEQLDQFKKRKYQYMAKDIEGRDVFLADSGYVLSMAQQDFEDIKFHFTSEF